MLRSLRIKNYVLIDSLDVSFPEGLIIITGQTGAGKSILLGALSLLSGAKADVTAISEGADNCLVEAEWDDGTVASRLVSRSGRSRCYINDEPVPAAELFELCSHRIDIHSQHQSLLLTDKSFQLSMLDHFADTDSLVGECRTLWKSIQDMNGQISDLKERFRTGVARRDYNEAQFKQLDEARLKEGEMEELEAELDRLSHAGQIKEALANTVSLLGGGEESGLPDLGSSLKEASRSLSRISGIMPSLAGICARIDSARIELDDVLSEVEKSYSEVDVSPERMRQVEDRLSLLYSLMKKHSCSTVSELIAVRDGFSDSLFDCTALEDRIREMEALLESTRASYQDLASRISAIRHEAAPRFAQEISASLHFLELENSIFEVSLNDVVPGASGTDAVQFRFSSTGTTAPVDVSKCASGGELSRIMLSLKAMMAGFAGMPTMIFDEIDTGVSGSVADKMGSMICLMGKSMQVFAITHLPQVAAKGNAHYLVTKRIGDGRTLSSISRIEGEERVMEIARLLSGASITPQAVANAKALLDCD